jgi:hypothetical protein
MAATSSFGEQDETNTKRITQKIACRAHFFLRRSVLMHTGFIIQK